MDNLPEPNDLAEEIIENLKTCLTSFRWVLGVLKEASWLIMVSRKQQVPLEETAKLSLGVEYS